MTLLLEYSLAAGNLNAAVPLKAEAIAMDDLRPLLNGARTTFKQRRLLLAGALRQRVA
jgi:hypothetical protein